MVHEAFETTVMSLVITCWLTPNTTVASTPSPGAETSTLRAPAVSSAEALSLLVNRPVHSIATSMSAYGALVGSRSAETRIGPQVRPPALMVMLSPLTATSAGKRPCTLS